MGEKEGCDEWVGSLGWASLALWVRFFFVFTIQHKANRIVRDISAFPGACGRKCF